MAADAVLFGAVGDWSTTNLTALRPEQAVPDLRKPVGLFCQFQPAICYRRLVGASSLEARADCRTGHSHHP